MLLFFLLLTASAGVLTRVMPSLRGLGNRFGQSEPRFTERYETIARAQTKRTAAR
jgi:hypothetical protein